MLSSSLPPRTAGTHVTERPACQKARVHLNPPPLSQNFKKAKIWMPPIHLPPRNHHRRHHHDHHHPSVLRTKNPSPTSHTRRSLSSSFISSFLISALLIIYADRGMSKRSCDVQISRPQNRPSVFSRNNPIFFFFLSSRECLSVQGG